MSGLFVLCKSLSLPDALLVAFLFVGISIVGFAYVKAKQYKNLPPGPPVNWWGRSQLPPGRSWLVLEKMQEQYGPIVTIRNGLFRPPTVYITRAAPAIDLLEKRGATTGDRPDNYVAGQVLQGGMGILFARYGEKFRRLRKAIHQQLMPKMAERYGPMSERAARNTLRDICDDSDNFAQVFHTYAASVVNALSFGRRTKTHYSDPSLVRALAYNRELTFANTPGAYKSEMFPFLLYWPGYLDRPRRIFKAQLEDYMSRANEIKQQMARGEAPPCTIRYLTERQEEYSMSDEEIAWTSGGLYHAGSDTTALTINHGVSAAAKHPLAQAKVKAELDAVVGSHRTPTFADQPYLPYLGAFVKEVLRWRSVNPLGFPHRIIQEEVLEGYTLPKDSVVYGVNWCLHRDPTLYDDVEAFKPERWLQDDGEGRLTLRDDMRHFAWGFGRRNCPGMHIAERSIFINLAHVMWAFDVLEDPVQPIGIDPDKDYRPAGISGPLPYKAIFRPRQGNLRNFLGEEEMLIEE